MCVEYSKCSHMTRGVVTSYITNDTMLLRSAQLILTTENDHFEDSMQIDTGRYKDDGQVALQKLTHKMIPSSS